MMHIYEGYYLTFGLQYRIFLDSFFYFLGYCKRKKRLVSATQMAINKNPNLITDFDANYDEVHSTTV